MRRVQAQCAIGPLLEDADPAKSRCQNKLAHVQRFDEMQTACLRAKTRRMILLTGTECLRVHTLMQNRQCDWRHRTELATMPRTVRQRTRLPQG